MCLEKSVFLLLQIAASSQRKAKKLLFLWRSSAGEGEVAESIKILVKHPVFKLVRLNLFIHYLLYSEEIPSDQPYYVDISKMDKCCLSLMLVNLV